MFLDQCSSGENCSKLGSTSESDDADQSNSKTVDKSPSSSFASSKLDCVQKILADEFQLLQLRHEDGDDKVLKSVDFDGLIEFWKETGFKNIITMVGAGISTCKKNNEQNLECNNNTELVAPI